MFELPSLTRSRFCGLHKDPMDWHGVEVLVTGAGGFIGSHLTEELLLRGARVRAFVRYNGRSDWGHIDSLLRSDTEQLEVIAGDIRDPYAVDTAVAGAAVIFHLAALIAVPQSYVAPASYVETNVNGTLNVLEAARRHATAKVVHTSTSEVYGSARYTPIDEEHPLQGQSPYSATKIGADKLAESYFRAFDLPVATIRPFNAFGPRQSARAIVPTIISQALFWDVIELGALNPIRDFTFVSDTVRAFMRIAEVPETVGQVVNIGSGQGVSISELVETIRSLTGSTAPVRRSDARLRPEASEVTTLVCDYSKAREVLGWEPEVRLTIGLERAIEWVKAHREYFRPSRYAT